LRGLIFVDPNTKTILFWFNLEGFTKPKPTNNVLFFVLRDNRHRFIKLALILVKKTFLFKLQQYQKIYKDLYIYSYGDKLEFILNEEETAYYREMKRVTKEENPHYVITYMIKHNLVCGTNVQLTNIDIKTEQEILGKAKNYGAYKHYLWKKEKQKEEREARKKRKLEVN